jgi:hypothetical protein
VIGEKACPVQGRDRGLQHRRLPGVVIADEGSVTRLQKRFVVFLLALRWTYLNHPGPVA